MNLQLPTIIGIVIIGGILLVVGRKLIAFLAGGLLIAGAIYLYLTYFR